MNVERGAPSFDLFMRHTSRGPDLLMNVLWVDWVSLGRWRDDNAGSGRVIDPHYHLICFGVSRDYIHSHYFFIPDSLSAGEMDIVIREEDISLAQIGVYASVSFLVVSAVGAALYTTCSKRYRLNWFEQNLLESANEKDEDQQR